ncbi:MAG: hydrolase [Cytophagales bacterium]|nr:MAG: hydrolase [Cytophagales bacterium]
MKFFSKIKILLLLFIIVFYTIQAVFAKPTPPGDEDNRLNYQLKVGTVKSSIRIDGKLDESDWLEAGLATNFWQKWPTDTALAEKQTEIRVMADDNFLYISAICYDNGKRVIQNLKRDVGHWESDAFTIMLDPMNERTTGFAFGVNAGGAQFDATIAVNEDSWDWDAKWYSAVSREGDRWVAEIAIPFKTLRYDPNNTQWGINFNRIDMQQNIVSAWAKVPIQQRTIDLGFTGALDWTYQPPSMNGNVVLIPYLTGGASQDIQNERPAEYTYNAGLDAKIAVSSSLNLDLTVNPDFSQVDVDVQVTNLSRFSIFFPERRSFFLENSDLVADLGSGDIRPFFSRRIGLSNGKSVPIVFGARLSGNLSKNWRIGIMNIQTASSGDYDGQNYAVAALQRRLLKRSNLKTFFINRQAFAHGNDEMKAEDYNRVAGAEFDFVSESNKWRGSLRYHYSFNTSSLVDNDYVAGTFNRQGRNINWGMGMNKVGDNFIADLGFVPRLYNYDASRDTTIRRGYSQYWNDFYVNLYSKNSKLINMQWFGFTTEVILNKDGSFNEGGIYGGWGVNFKSRSWFNLNLNITRVALPYATSIIDGDPLPATEYEYGGVSLNYGSDPRKKFSWRVFGSYGGFYNGTRVSYGGGINFRQQPWGNFGVDFNQNEVYLPENYGTASLTLISPKVEISFTNNMFWTTFLQYNTQADNFNINSRFQWRFKPMSDLFIVYTDNYVAENFKEKNRGIVLKINYWLNL